MDVERIVFRLVADASSYFNVLDTAQSRLLFFTSFVTQHMTQSALRMAAEFEQAAVSFEVMTGSATAARDILGDLQRLALETPFTFSDVLKSAKQVKAFGFDVADITTVVGRLGDVAAGTGTDINRIILAFGQVRTTGRLMGQELRQFSNAGVPILEMLARVTGESVSAIPQLVRQGRISFTDVSRAFNLMTNEGGLFHNMMQRISRETIGGRWQNFVESLALATRNWGLMAIEVFHVRDGLAALGEYFQAAGTNEAIAEWRDRLEQVRATFSLIGSTAQAVWEAVVGGIKAAWESLQSFYQSHRTLINTTAMLVAGWFAAKAAIAGIAMAGIALIGILNTIMRVQFVIYTVTKSILALQILLNAQAMIGSIIYKSYLVFAGFRAILMLLMNPFGLILVALTSIGVAFLLLSGTANELVDTIVKMGETFMGVARLMQSDFLESWRGIVDAVKGGDLTLAFDIGVATIKVMWKGLIFWLGEEWNAFTIRMGNRFGDTIEDTFLNTRDALEAWLTENIGGNAALARNMRLRAAELSAARTAERNVWRAQRGLTGEGPTPEAIAAFMRSLPEFRRMQELSDQGRVTGQLGVEITRLTTAINQQTQRVENGAPVISPRFITTPEVAPAVAGLLGPAAVGLSDLYQEMAGNLAGARNLLDAWTEKMRTGVRDGLLGAVPTQADLDRQAGRVRTLNEELNRLAQAMTATTNATTAARRQLPTPPEVSAGARRAAQELERIFGEGGTSPIDHFLSRMQHVNEAFRGPLPEELMGVLPAAAVVGVRTFGGLINEQMRDFGLARAYAEFQRTLPNEQDRRPGAAMAGSREAQEIINRAQGQQLTVQEQIRAEIATGNYIAQQQASHTAQVVAVLRGMAAQQGGKILGVRVDGGGGE